MLKGITKCCPLCRKILIRYVNTEGKSDFEMICPHCKETVKVIFDQMSKVVIDSINK